MHLVNFWQISQQEQSLCSSVSLIVSTKLLTCSKIYLWNSDTKLSSAHYDLVMKVMYEDGR